MLDGGNQANVLLVPIIVLGNQLILCYYINMDLLEYRLIQYLLTELKLFCTNVWTINQKTIELELI